MAKRYMGLVVNFKGGDMDEQHKKELKEITERIDIAVKGLIVALEQCNVAMRNCVEAFQKIRVKMPKEA